MGGKFLACRREKIVQVALAPFQISMSLACTTCAPSTHPLVCAPAPDVRDARLLHRLHLHMHRLPASRRVRTAGHLPLARLVSQTIPDAELGGEDSGCDGSRGSGGADGKSNCFGFLQRSPSHLRRITQHDDPERCQADTRNRTQPRAAEPRKGDASRTPSKSATGKSGVVTIG